MFWVKENAMLNVHWTQEPIPLYHWVTRRKAKRSSTMMDRRANVRLRASVKGKRPHLIDTVGALDERLSGCYQWPRRVWQRCEVRL